MGFLSWIFVGGIAGWLSGKLMGSEGRGCFTNIIVGIIGGFLGGLVIGLLGGTGVTGFNLWSIFVAVIGAVLFTGLLNYLKKR